MRGATPEGSTIGLGLGAGKAYSEGIERISGMRGTRA